MNAEANINSQAHISLKHTTTGLSSNGNTPRWSVSELVMKSRLDQMVLGYLSCYIQWACRHSLGNLVYTSVLSLSMKLCLHYPEVTVFLYVFICVHTSVCVCSCLKGSSSTVTGWM